MSDSRRITPEDDARYAVTRFPIEGDKRDRARGVRILSSDRTWFVSLLSHLRNPTLTYCKAALRL